MTKNTTTSSDWEFDFLIYIGRFHPLHLGHQWVIDTALKKSKRVVMLVGSANMPRSTKNMFTFPERKEMIQLAYPDEVAKGRIIIEPLNDIMYDDDRWLAQVQAKLTAVLLDHGNNHGIVLDGMNDFRVGVIGFEKDDTSYYLKMFPQWSKVEVAQWGTLSATDIRDNYLRRAPILPHDLCSEPVIDWLKKFMLTPDFAYVLAERESLQKKYFDPWKGSPYPPHFCTADAVVTQSGHVLLVRRAEFPGKGLLAIPGGHIKPSIGGAFPNAIAELWEEARPSDGHSGKGKPMPKGRLAGFYTGVERRFDQPGRDPRGFYSTTAFRFVFPNGKLWDVRGGLPLEDEQNDVDHAGWYPIASLDPSKMFADHYFIIQQMLATKGER